MANRLEFSSSIDSSGYARGIRDMEVMSATAGNRMATALNGTTAGYRMGQGSAAGMGGRGGVIGETVVLFREMGRGNYSRIPGSITILAQRMGVLKYFMDGTAEASIKFAQATELAALRAQNLAKWAAEEAAATRLAYEAKDSDVIVTLAQVDADEAAAVAARVNAEAMREQAAAANLAAASAKAGVGPLGILTGILIGLAAGFYAAYKQSKALIDKLSGFKVPDFEPKYIPQHLQAVNRITEEWKAIGKEVESVTEKYNSVSEAAKRTANETKTQYEHLRRMNDLSNSTDKDKAARRLEIDNAERQVELANKIKEQADLVREGNAAQARADGITVTSKERDENIIERNKAMYDAANEAAKKIEESKMEGTFGMNGRDIFRAYNIATDSGVSTSDLDAAEKQVFEDRAKWKKAYETSIDQMAANDETRKTQEQLTKKAGESLAEASKTSLEIVEMRKANAIAGQNESEESASKLAQRTVRSGSIGGSSDSLVKVGNFLGSARGQIETLAAEHVRIARETLGHIKTIARNTAPRSAPPGEHHYPIH
jgi:hypothetical protein